MPRMNGMEATREIRKRIVVLTVHETEEHILGALSGVSGSEKHGSRNTIPRAA